MHSGADFGRLIATRFVDGAGFLAVAVAAPTPINAAAAPADRRFALPVWSTYMPAGAGLAMALSALLLPTTGWRGLRVLRHFAPIVWQPTFLKEQRGMVPGGVALLSGVIPAAVTTSAAVVGVALGLAAGQAERGVARAARLGRLAPFSGHRSAHRDTVLSARTAGPQSHGSALEGAC